VILGFVSMLAREIKALAKIESFQAVETRQKCLQLPHHHWLKRRTFLNKDAVLFWQVIPDPL
jgi:hypothetical protein